MENKIGDTAVQDRIAALITQVENDPEQWYKLLIEKIVVLETQVQTLTDKVEALEDYAEFQSALVDGHYLEKPALLQAAIEVTAQNTLLPDEGFYNMETSHTGYDFRWTNKDFYFDLPVDRDAQKTIMLELASAIKPELLQEIRCHADGLEVALKKVRAEKGHLYQGVLPPKAQVLHATRLSFHVCEAHSPKEFDPDTPDSRMLAVTFKTLTVG